MAEPLVSVLIPYYNDEDFLRESIENVLGQTYKNFELILLNHASTDSSRQIAHSFDDKRIKHIDMNKNLGAGSGVLLIKFMELAQGKYAKLFCADDIMKPNCIEVLVNYLENNPDKDIVYADMDYVRVDRKPLYTKWSQEKFCWDFDMNELDVLKYLFKGIGFLPYPSTMVRMDALRSANIDRTFIMVLDMSIWADLIIAGKKIKFIKDSLVWYRIHDGQISSANSRDLAYKRSEFESLKYTDVFFKIQNLEMLKYLCEDVPFIDDVTENDKKYFPFLIAYQYLMQQKNQLYRYMGYNYIHDLVNDDERRMELESRFGFGIKQFRELYSYIHKSEKNKISFKEWKEKVYSCKTKNLKIHYLLFLFGHRLFELVSFKKLRIKLKRKKEYTL